MNKETYYTPDTIARLAAIICLGLTVYMVGWGLNDEYAMKTCERTHSWDTCFYLLHR